MDDTFLTVCAEGSFSRAVIVSLSSLHIIALASFSEECSGDSYFFKKAVASSVIKFKLLAK